MRQKRTSSQLSLPNGTKNKKKSNEENYRTAQNLEETVQS